MKLSILIAVFTTFQVSATLYSQDSKLTLEVENKPLIDVIRSIEQQSNYRFFFSDNYKELNYPITISLKDETIKDVMASLLDSKNITYQLLENNIVVLTPMDQEIYQQLKVSGKVTDATTNEPLPGVYVVIEGTNTGVITDVNGQYGIEVPDQNTVLLFSSVGFISEKITVSGNAVIDVSLIVDIQNLEEIVIVGYGTQKKINLTGAVGALDSEDLKQRPLQNTSQLLQGLVPGLNVYQKNGGGLNSEIDINIRGVATIGEGSKGSPLVLIDGMEGNMNALNPQDIENISVLKDAAASSIYGSRAPFGVILITTKKGKIGKAEINYNNNFRWSYPLNMPDMMDSYSFALYFNDANINGGATPYFTEERLQRIKDYQDGIITEPTIVNPKNTLYWGNGYAYGNTNIDWYKEYFKNRSFSQEHNISVSGGTENMQYYFSGNFLDQGGLLAFSPDIFNRYSTTAKINGKINEWASINIANRYIREEFERPSSLTTDFFSALARQGWPTIALYDPNGYINNSWVLSLKDGGRDKTQKDNMFQQIQLVLEPIKGWKTYGEFNFRTLNNLNHYDVQKTYLHDVNGNPYLSNTNTEVYEKSFRETFINTNIYTEYSKELGEGHFLKGLLGFQSEQYNYRDVSAKRNGIILESIPVLDATSGVDASGKLISPTVRGIYSDWATCGFFGRINYDFRGRYLLEVNLRYDGTSRFRADQRWNLFPSVSAGWNIARENFWQPYENLVSTFKLRASYGELGNQNTDSYYPTYQTMTVGASDGSWLVGGLKPNTASSPALISQGLTWERVRSWNTGLDMAAFKGRFSSSFDYFIRYTYDMVGPATELPAILGTAVPKTNNTDLKSYGFEVSIAWKDRLNNGLGYSLGFLLSDSQTEITRYPNDTKTIYDTKSGKYTYRSGQKVGEIWGFETIGIARTQDEMDNHLLSLPDGDQKALGTQWEAGDIMYKDLNGDNKIDFGAWTEDNHGDVKKIGSSAPRFAFSFNMGVDWKGFDVHALVQGIMKRDYFQDSYYFWGAYKSGIWWSTGFEEHKDYFRNDPSHYLGENLDSYYPRPVFNSKNQQVQTRYLQNAAYIRLKNLQFGYTLPHYITSKIKINNLRIFFTGENLWTGTKMIKMFDPETVEGGYGGNAYPLSRVLSLGLSVNF